MGEAPPFLPYGRQLVDEDDIAAVTEVLRGDWLTTGPMVERLEEAVRGYIGAEHAVACANGTAALHLATMALGLGPGDKVIVPAVTFLATANAATYVGAEVVFADCDAGDGLMGPAELEDALERAGPGVKAVFPVHLAGQCSDLDAIYAIARRHGLAVVEDAAHAIGTRITGTDGRERFIGDCPEAGLATFSFHPVKTMTMGEGGMVTTNDARLAERARRLRSHGMRREPAAFENSAMAFMQDGGANPWYYEMAEPGFNYRATDFQCALGLSQFKKLERFVAQRRALAERYDTLLRDLQLPVTPIRRNPLCTAAWHLYAVLIDFDEIGIERGAVMRRLRERGIGTQVHYIPVHTQPFYRRKNEDLSLPGAERYYAQTLSLPLFAGMDEDDVERVAAALQASLR